MRTAARRGVDRLATLIRIVGWVIVGVLVAHIALTLLDANPANSATRLITDLVGYVDLGIDDLFLPASHKLAVTVNYGLAALAWYLITAVAQRLVRRIG